MSLSTGKSRILFCLFYWKMEVFYILAKEVRLISLRIRYVQLAFFTSREVKALEELTWVGILE